MRRQVRLYIGGSEADLGEGDLILFNYTNEDLTNPTVVKNTYTQQVTLKGTPTNNDIFGHIWRLDRLQNYGGGIGPDFDPSRKTGFQLFDMNGTLLESGYVKLDQILRHGQDIQYGVTLYGGLGSFLYSLAFDGDGNQRRLADLDFLGTSDPDRELDFTINATAVQAAWARLLSNPSTVSDKWDVVNFAPCYNGIPDRFEASMGIVQPADIGMPASITVDGTTYSPLNGWTLFKMTKGMTEWEAKDLRSYLQRPVVSVKAVLNALTRKSNNGGYIFDASVLDGSNYDGMWLTLPMLPSLDSYKNIQETITLSVDGTTANDSFSIPVSISSSLQVGSKVDVNMNIAFRATVSGATATPLYFGRSTYSGGIGTTERYDYSGFFAQLVAYDSQDVAMAASKILCIGASDDFGQLAKDGKARAEACGYMPQVETEYSFIEAVMAGGAGSYGLSTDLNFTVSTYDATKYKLWITPYHFRKTIHFGELYRKTWRSHALGTSAMKVYFSGNEYTYTAMRLSTGSAGSTASYKTPESVRSGAAVTKAMLLSTDYTPADFLLGIVKTLGLYLHYDGVAKKVTLMSRNSFYKPDIVDIDTRIDRGREMQISPIAFDTKWLEMSSDPIGGAFEDYYKETYGQDYGIQRIGTGYEFNSEASKIMESVVFKSGVQACETSRYFNDVSGTPGPVPSQMLDAGNTLGYRSAAGDISEAEVPVISAPTITYWGNSAFTDVEGYDWLTAFKLQAHGTDGKAADGSGVLLFRSGVQYYAHFKVSDDIPEMITLTGGQPCWQMNDGAGVTVPIFCRCQSLPIYERGPEYEGIPMMVYKGEGLTVALDFGRVQELASPHTTYYHATPTITVYEKMWKAYLRDRYDVNTRVVTAWVNMRGIQVTADCLRKFWYFDNSLWCLNRIINYSVTTDDPVQCEFVKVQDQTAYIAGQDFGGQQLRGILDLTVTPASAVVSIDGSTVVLTAGQANVSLTAGQHVVVASESGYATATQVVTIRPEETTVVSITLAAGAEQFFITVDPPEANPVITMTLDGVSTAYTAGMNVNDGVVVALTVSASGYATQTRTFTMSPANANQYFSLVPSINATITPVEAEITKNAQNVVYTISDPSNHGWTLDYNGPDAYGEITGSGVTSGNATAHTGYISGTGDAVVYLSVAANTGNYTRSIYRSPFRFSDNVTAAKSNLLINQQGVLDSQVLVTSVTLNKNTTTIGVNGSERLIATVSPSNATNKNLTWSSSNTSKVQVSQDGTIYGIATGQATVTAASTDGSNKSAVCTVTVTNAIAVQGVALNRNTAQVAVGGTVTLQPIFTPSNASNKTVSWASSNTSKATVSGGVVTGVAAGTSTITVTTQDGGYTATCLVTVVAQGTMTAQNVTAKSQATSASSALTLSNMNTGTITASCSASWVTGVSVDTSGNPVRVRLTLQPNSSATSRSTTVTVVGQDTSGSSITTTFTLSQNGKTPSDIPCQTLTLNGPDNIQNSDNTADYYVDFDPANTTQDKVTWTVTDYANNPTAYAEVINATDSRCTVRILSGANNVALKVKAVNYYNSSVYATKNITATYVGQSAYGYIQVSEGFVELAAASTSDNSVTVTLVNMNEGLGVTVSKTGFITSASLSGGKVVITFPANTTAYSRTGTVTLTGTNNMGAEVSSIITYEQAGRPGTNYGFQIDGLQVTGSHATFSVTYFNESASSRVISRPFYTLLGYFMLDEPSASGSGYLADKTIAGMAQETEIYDIDFNLYSYTNQYTLTLTADDGAITDTYTGDGTDVIS